MQRRDARWSGDGADTLSAAAPRQYGEPQNPAWTDVPPRGKGRGVEVDSWKPRGEGGEWRSSTDGTALGSTGGWRNERWGGGGGASSGNVVPGAPSCLLGAGLTANVRLVQPGGLQGRVTDCEGMASAPSSWSRATDTGPHRAG